MNRSGNNAPGWPGIEPRWTSSMKSGVGTATSASSQVWFTLSHGILNEIYYPAIDMAATRDFGLLVSGPGGFVSEEKRDSTSQIEALDAGVPAFRLINRCNHGRYVITKTVISDPLRDVVLQRIRFQPLVGAMADYKVYALLSPHLNNSGWGNNGWLGDYKGHPMLFAEHENLALALASSCAPVQRSCGYVGSSDGWSDLNQNRSMQWSYARAENGNIALMAEFDPAACGGEFTLTLGFGRSVAQAGQKARASLLENFDGMVASYVDGWREFHAGCLEHSCPERNGFDVYRVSTAVLRTHESKQYPGAMIASLSIPWGSTRSDRDLGGYHLVWSRDLVESAGGLLASGDVPNARQTLIYLMSTQEADGHWPQNMWLSGESFWGGIQADETAFFILLADALRRAGELGTIDPYPAVKSACHFLITTGPSTGQDRWEENAGYTCFTLAVEIAALLAAADFAELRGHGDIAGYLRESADSWNDIVDPLTYVRDTPLARQVGVDGYYLRIAPPECVPGDDIAAAPITIHNRPADEAEYRAGDIVSVDALALVRFGLRAPDDPKILNTLKVIDAVLKTETATGPGWYRYNHDGYGEHADGSAFDGTGIGRVWPLLAGERAHYELAAGNHAEAAALLEVMVDQSSEGGLFPEQVWDAADIPQRELFNGRATGSAMPLVWAHSECIKLIRSLALGRVFDMPPQTVARYQGGNTPRAVEFWRFNFQRKSIPKGRPLRVEVYASAEILWTRNGWVDSVRQATRDTGLGLHIADLPVAETAAGEHIEFTFFWPEAQKWEGRNFMVYIDEGISD